MRAYLLPLFFYCFIYTWKEMYFFCIIFLNSWNCLPPHTHIVIFGIYCKFCRKERSKWCQRRLSHPSCQYYLFLFVTLTLSFHCDKTLVTMLFGLSPSSSSSSSPLLSSSSFSQWNAVSVEIAFDGIKSGVHLSLMSEFVTVMCHRRHRRSHHHRHPHHHDVDIK